MNDRAPDPAEVLSTTVASLRNERDGLRRAMRTRAIIEQAKGVLVERMGISSDAAFDQLVALSQTSNVKLVELAAALVGNRAPEPVRSPAPAVPLAEMLREQLRRPVDRREPAARAPGLEALQAQHQLLAGRIATAESYDELAETLAVATPGWAAPRTVVLLMIEADGALRLIGAAGMSPEERSQWSRVPPIPDLPIVVAVHTQNPVVLGDPSAVQRAFPVVADLPYGAGALVALPLTTEDGLLGVLGVSWDEALDLTGEVEQYLRALADPCARRCAELAAPVGIEPEVPGSLGDAGTLPFVLETLHDPTLVLSAVHDGDRIVDFRIEHANSTARAVVEVEHVQLADASLLTILPSVGSRVLLPALVEVVQSGTPCRLANLPVEAGREGTRGSYTLDIRANRLWERVLLTWRVRTPAGVLAAQLREARRALAALLPSPPAGPVGELEAAGSSAGAGSWCEAFALPDGSTVLVVGDVAGADPTVDVGRVSAVVRGHALAGRSPAALLGALNAFVVDAAPERGATVVVARFTPATGELTWAAAGQAVLVHVTEEDTRVLPGPLGLPLGVAPGLEYAEATVRLVKRDRLLVCTDALLTAGGRGLADGMHAVVVAAREGLATPVGQGALLTVEWR